MKKVVFPIAGVSQIRSKRLDAAARYSELRQIVDTPIIAFAIAEARAAGFSEFIFVTCDEKAELEREISSDWSGDNLDLIATEEDGAIRPGEAVFVRQERRRGIGDAVRSARALLDGEPFAVMIPNLLVLGNAPALADMVKDYSGTGVMLGVTEVQKDELNRYGVVRLEGDDVREIVEKPQPEDALSNDVAFGRWILPSAILDLLDGAEGEEISLTEAIMTLSQTVPVKGQRIRGECFNLRTQEGMVKATVAHAMRIPEYSTIVEEVRRDFIDEGVRTLRSAAFARNYDGLHPHAVLAQAILEDFDDGIALVSSFGADSAVLLHMVSRIDPAMPVLFLETGMLFEETLTYQQELAQHLGLTGVRLIRPTARVLEKRDPANTLHQDRPDACCHIRKTAPMENALGEFSAWITGRKRYQSNTRAELPLFEEDAAGRIKINPLVGWGRAEIDGYLTRHALPRHPLVAQNYPSVGCWPCTTQVKDGEDERSGRWRDSEKSECGIHLVDGKLVRIGA